jgi:hypothetical protein
MAQERYVRLITGEVVDLWDALRISQAKKGNGRKMPTDQMTGLTKLTCEFNLIDHNGGDQYLYVRVETEVPTIAGDWDDYEQAKDVFNEVLALMLSESIELDEGVRLYKDGDLIA